MRRLIIGDIHGCDAALRDLLDKAGLSAGDEIVALGDFLDRGRGSPAVFDFFQKSPSARSIIGNHERRHVRSFRGELAPALSQRITRWQFGDARHHPAACAALAAFSAGLRLQRTLLSPASGARCAALAGD